MLVAMVKKNCSVSNECFAMIYYHFLATNHPSLI